MTIGLQYVLPAAVGLAVSFLVFRYSFLLGYIPSSSMYPTYKQGDIVVAKRLQEVKDACVIKKGDIVVFHHEGRVLIKRVIALPSQRVEIGPDGIFIDGSREDDPYAYGSSSIRFAASAAGGRIPFDEEAPVTASYVLPDRSYFVMGDNREDSMDSRYWDYPFVKEEDILGVVYENKR